MIGIGESNLTRRKDEILQEVHAAICSTLGLSGAQVICLLTKDFIALTCIIIIIIILLFE